MLNNLIVRMVWDVDAAVTYADYSILYCWWMPVPLFIVYVRVELHLNSGVSRGLCWYCQSKRKTIPGFINY